MRVSGLTVQPSPEDVSIALARLESMAAEWEDVNVCTGYAFELDPDPNTLHNVPRKYWAAYDSNVAFKLLTDFGKEIPATLMMEKSATFSRASASTSVQRQTPYPSRQPRGAGNTLRWNRWRRYYNTAEDSPISCETNRMIVGDIDDFQESFSAYLVSSEDISTYTIEADTGLKIVSDSLTSPSIDYRIEAEGVNDASDNSNSQLQVKIVMTTTSGRVETRLINFSLTDVE